jgi:hypothetical protein
MSQRKEVTRCDAYIVVEALTFAVEGLSKLPIEFRPDLGVVHHGGGQEPFSTMICGYFSLSRPSRSGVLELLPPILHLRVHPQVFVQPSPQRLQLAQEAMMLA